MKTPYTITELDALINACVAFTDQHEPYFPTNKIAGREGVNDDIDSVKRMMDWVTETDKGLLEHAGLGQKNVPYFRLGRDAQRIMNDGGFALYFRNKRVREWLEPVRKWAPICISILAAIVSILAWQVPKDSSSRVDNLTTQLSELRSDQEQTKSMVITIQENLSTIEKTPIGNGNLPSGGTTRGSTTSPGNSSRVTIPANSTIPADTPPQVAKVPEPLVQLFGPLDQPWLLVASIVMFFLSFFLFYQASGFQLWVTSQDKAAPNPWAGATLAVILSLLIVAFSVLYWMVYHRPPLDLHGPDAFIWFLSNRPSELATGPLLASIVPTVIALFKFVTTGFIMGGNNQDLPKLSRSPAAAMAGAVFALISLASSIATLIMFFIWVKNP